MNLDAPLAGPAHAGSPWANGQPQPKVGGHQDAFLPLDGPIALALRESIEQRGVLVPIVIDQHGRILDGHNRFRIARDLGVPCPSVTVRVENHQDGRDVALLLNTVRRHLDVEQRRQVVAQLRTAGHSLRAIAGAVGTSKTTVKNDLDKPGVQGCTPERATGQDGKTYPARRPEPAPLHLPGDMGNAPILAGPEPAPSPEPPADPAPPPLPVPPVAAAEPEPEPTPLPAPPEPAPPKPPTLRDAPESQEAERLWRPVRMIGKALVLMPTVAEVVAALPPDSVEEFDRTAEVVAKWAADWAAARKDTAGLRLVGGTR